MPKKTPAKTRATATPAATDPLVPVPDVMTIEQLAAYLHLATATLYRKVQEREIPFTKVGNLLRFTKTSIDRWLARNTTTPDDDLLAQFARLQNRYHFQKWLEGRGVDWQELTDKQLADLAAKALTDLREAGPEGR